MAKSVENEGNFEALLSRLAQGLTIDDKLKANKSGADIFKKNLKLQRLARIPNTRGKLLIYKMQL